MTKTEELIDAYLVLETPYEEKLARIVQVLLAALQMECVNLFCAERRVDCHCAPCRAIEAAERIAAE